MSDWQIGDLALCVSDGHPLFDDRALSIKVGKCYTVRKVGRPIYWLNYERALGFLEAHPARGESYGWPESMFVKVTPPEADEFDREVIGLMNRAPETAHEPL